MIGILANRSLLASSRRSGLLRGKSLDDAGAGAQVVGLAKGIVAEDAAEFDRHPDLINVANGVIDLRTGELGDHDPNLLFTKITEVRYVPGATSPDWDIARNALPAEVADWLQVRIGQAATGHPTSDDILPVAQGGGANGKTTLFGSVQKALGEHAVVVPDRLILNRASDHPTELMTLRGTRFALIEETPESRRLDTKRLKDLSGSPY
jgi:putative DNA primase/helicase